MKAEFIKARVRRGCASVGELKAHVLKDKGRSDVQPAVYPRWVRVNNMRSDLDAQLGSTFSSYRRANSLSELDSKEPSVYVDPTIPDLLAVNPGVDLTASPSYRKGEIILQDKASCFPAYLLIGQSAWEGDLLDGCAAPGNKTTHLASLLSKQKLRTKSHRPRIYSMDASSARSKTLQKMVSSAGAGDIVTILPGQDFLALNPDDSRFAHVSGLLLDPSCSGSGIIGRDDVPQFILPASKPGKNQGKGQGKKRKRRHDDDDEEGPRPALTNSNSTDENELADPNIDLDRLTKLSNIQTHIVERALTFSSATRVTYSTCSIHMIENEAVVCRVLMSDVARRRGWRVMRREEQPEGLRAWKHRGTREGGDRLDPPMNLSDEELDGCLRCWPGDEEGLGGFFVAGFVRNPEMNGDEEEEWQGFSD